MSFPEHVRDVVGPRRRVALSELWQALAAHDPVVAAGPRARAELARLLEAGEDDGLWQRSVSRDRGGDPPLPAHVTLAAVAQDPPSAPVPWRPELSFAGGLALRPAQREVLLAVNRWLARRAGDDLPVVPSAERSLEVFGDEKAIDRQAGGATLWRAGRLDEDLLAFRRSAPPIVWEHAGDGDTLLVVENQATFLSLVRALRELGSGRYGAVAWGEGNQVSSRIATAGRAGMRLLAYFGDLDRDGLAMAAKGDATARIAGLGPLLPATGLYRMLLDTGWTQPESSRVSTTTAEGLAWLPPDLQSPVSGLLDAGRRAAQEAVGYEQLIANPARWARPND